MRSINYRKLLISGLGVTVFSLLATGCNNSGGEQN